MNPIQSAGYAILADNADLPGGIDSITSLIQDNAIPLVITIVGLFAIFLARRGDVSGVLTIFIAVCFGVAILVFALPGPRDAILAWFSSLITAG